MTNKMAKQPLTIVYPGGTSIKKGVDVVIEMLYRLKRSKLPFKFIWIGQTLLPSAKYSILGLRETTKMLQDERIEIKGLVSREKAEDIIGSANIFLLPSRGEGCPMTLLEAMLVGCIPVVSDAKHASRELIEKCGCGFIVEQDNSKELANEIKEVIEHHSAYTEVYSQTRSFSDSFLSFENWKTQMERVMSFALTDEKKCIPINEASFETSLKNLQKLDKENRINEIINSIMVRIRLDYMYLRYKGWK